MKKVANSWRSTDWRVSTIKSKNKEKDIDKVYLVQHCYEFDGLEEIKIIGVYTSRLIAEQVVSQYILLEGFRDYPDDFHICEYKLNENQWETGFIIVY